MSWHIPVLLLALSLAAPPASAFSVADDRRQVHADVLICCDGGGGLMYFEETVDATQPLFDTTASVSGYSAQQTSEIGSSSLTGSGSVSGSYDGDADSVFEVDLLLDEPRLVRFEGAVTGQDDWYNEVWATASLTPEHTFTSYGTSVPFLIDTVLGPGLHTLTVHAHAGEVQSLPGIASFSFSLTVPEPSSGLLLLAGLATALGSRRRSRRRP
jgi:hypothetical protein